MKYRYEREINRGHRSALKKILEKDEVSTKFLILCVATIKSEGTVSVELTAGTDESAIDASSQRAIIELTDGWYSINAMCDEQLTKQVLLGRIYPGLKLRVFGAEVVGSEAAASPLEITESTMMKLGANGTRRALWHSKLGFQRAPAFTVPLHSLVSNGGIVPCVEVVVQRRYPLMYMETLPDGSKVTRDEVDEENVRIQYMVTMVTKLPF